MSEELYEIFTDFLNDVEAAAVNAKRQIAEVKGVAEKEEKWSPDKIKWEDAQGTHGPYEKSEDVNSVDFKEMLKDLAQHNGKLSQAGYFYWTFMNGTTVGRKKKK
jgi:hypothetical protein